MNRVAAIAVVTPIAVMCASACSRDLLSMSPPSAGFWYEGGSYVLPTAAANRYDRPLSVGDLETIERLSRIEIERAFSGLRIAITTNRRAFWRVGVVQSIPTRSHQLPTAGESLALGALGGQGLVDFDMVASEAIQYAPPHMPRQAVLEAIARGTGRVAVHEFMHQILGAAAAHNDADPDSYEYGRPNRRSQYYGGLHWSSALPLLQKKLGHESNQPRNHELRN